MMDIKEVLVLWFTSFLIKKAASGSSIKPMQNQQLAVELHKIIIKKN